MLFLFAIFLGIVAGLLTGGKLGNLGRIRFRWPWLVVLAVLVRGAVLLTPLNRVEGAQYVYVLSLAAIGAWTAVHWRRLPGVWMVTVGSALNLLVIVANGGRMPVGHVLRTSQLAQKSFPRNADNQWPIIQSKALKISKQLEIVLKRFTESDSRIKRDGHGINAAL